MESSKNPNVKTIMSSGLHQNRPSPRLANRPEFAEPGFRGDAVTGPLGVPEERQKHLRERHRPAQGRHVLPSDKTHTETVLGRLCVSPGGTGMGSEGRSQSRGHGGRPGASGWHIPGPRTFSKNELYRTHCSGQNVLSRSLRFLPGPSS